MKFVPNSRVAVVVPVHNRRAHTARLLAELRLSNFDEALVMVVDDGSRDGTSEYLREHHPDVVVLPGSGSLWWSGAANLGCRFSIERNAAILILFNNDNLRISPNCISELTRCVEALGGCASSVALEDDGTVPPRILHAGGALMWPWRGIVLKEVGREYRRERGIVECDWLPGMSLAFSADLFMQLGGFDEHAFPQYRGDTDFTLRARLQGKSCVVSYNCWVSNDVEQSGLDFRSRVSLKSFVVGLFSLRSNYQLRSTVRFARRYCPPRFIAIHLLLFYMRYVYATLKTWIRAIPRTSPSR